MTYLNDYLRDIHAKQYKGLDDEMGDDYQEWVDGLTIEELDGYLRKHFLKEQENYVNTNTR